MDFISVAFTVANLGYFAARLGSIALTALVFFYGLGQVKSSLDIATGNYNIPAIRYSGLGAIVLYQIYLAYLILQKVSKPSKESAPAAKAKVQKAKPKKKEGKMRTEYYFNWFS